MQKVRARRSLSPGPPRRKWGLESVPQTTLKTAAVQEADKTGQPGRFKDKGRDFILQRTVERSWETGPLEGRGMQLVSLQAIREGGVNYQWDQRPCRLYPPGLQGAGGAVSAQPAGGWEGSAARTGHSSEES